MADILEWGDVAKSWSNGATITSSQMIRHTNSFGQKT